MKEAVGQVERLDPAAAGEDIRCEWRRLALARENPFLTPEWFESWHDSGSEEPWVLLWRRRPGAEIDAVLPLVLGHDGRARSLRFPGADHGDWYGVACGPDDEGAAAAAFLTKIRELGAEWDVLRLDRVEDGRAWSGMRAVRPDDVLPFLSFGDGGYEGWLASRSRNFRSQLGRRRRRAEGEHRAEYHDTPQRADLEAALETLFRFHEERRRTQGGEGVLGERARRAYGRFAELALAQGWLRMHSLELDGEPAAAWYGWRLGRRYLYGLSGFDPAREDLAVGTLLLAHTIERAAAEGCAVYDLLWGDEAYKERYATGRRTVASLATASGLRGRVALAGRRGLSRVSHSLPDGARHRLRSLRARAGR
ncbi:MAG TPA: GNAT family N-acetyltransferase [Solirubrobacterales bacterium]